MLASALRALINNSFYESFDTTFMENEKIVKILITFFFSFPIFYLGASISQQNIKFFTQKKH